jgi:hypothetical protein
MSPETHPAKFHPNIIGALSTRITADLVLDVFGGEGGIHDLRDSRLFGPLTVSVEIELPWCQKTRRDHPGARVICANSEHLPIRTGSVPCLGTSPAYGCRMSDDFGPNDTSSRHFYALGIRRLTGDPNYQLHPRNAAARRIMFFPPPDPAGRFYRELHENVWPECVRVLQRAGRMYLNCKAFPFTEHKAARVASWDPRYYVALEDEPDRFLILPTAWHRDVLVDLGLVELAWEHVPTTKGKGRNPNASDLTGEDLLTLEKVRADQ